MLIGGEELVVSTLATKDNVLFAGNIKMARKRLELTPAQIGFNPTTDIAIVYEQHELYNDALYNYEPYTLTIPIRS